MSTPRAGFACTAAGKELGLSTLTWLAFSDADRRRAQDALSLLRDRDTRDELGLGGVRDAFSELLFPGTSTIQTRAGYFLFVPWIYRALEQQTVQNARARAQRAEQQLIPILSASDDPEGTIGLRAGPDVRRLPSSVYWQGLQKWGIRRAALSIDRYHAWLEHPLRRRRERDDDGLAVEDSLESAWDPQLPPAPSDFPASASFALRADDARYLRDRILIDHPNTMLAALVDRADPAIEVGAPWNHPIVRSLPASVKELLDHAELFALVSHGAALLYNLYVAERAESAESIDRFRIALGRWSRDMVRASGRLGSWDVDRFWDLARPGSPRRGDARGFFDAWRGRVVPTLGAGLADDRDARRQLRAREIAVKGEKNARLVSPSALARWGGESGAGRMLFRWGSVQRITRDIRQPMINAGAR